MLTRGVSRRCKVQIATFFGYKNPTAHVLLGRVSQSLGSIQGSGDENDTNPVWPTHHACAKPFHVLLLLLKKTHPRKFAPTLALKWYPQDLIGGVNLFDISSANQSQGGNAFLAPAFPVWPAKRRVFYRGQFVTGLGVLIIILLQFVKKKKKTLMPTAVTDIYRACYSSAYTMMAKPVKTLELHFSMT